MGETDSNDFPQIVQVVSDEDEVKPDVPPIYSGINFLKIYLFMAVLGLYCCTWTFLQLCQVGGYSLVGVCGLLLTMPLLLQSMDPEHRLSSYGTQI